MTTETTETAETVESDGSAEFAEGFNSVAGSGATPGQQPPAAPAKPAETPPPQPPATPAEPAATPEPAPAPSAFSLTKEQFDALVAKTSEVDTIKSAVNKLSGHVGTVLEKLNAPPPAKAEPPAAEIDPATFAETYGEDVAKFVQQESAKAAAAAQKAGLSPEEVDARFNERAAQLEEQIIYKLEVDRLKEMHPDAFGATGVIESNGYKLWLATQPPEVQKTAIETRSARELGKILTDYKGFASKSQKSQSNKDRLAAALVPQGVPGAHPAEPTEEDAFRAGFASVAGRK